MTVKLNFTNLIITYLLCLHERDVERETQGLTCEFL